MRTIFLLYILAFFGQNLASQSRTGKDYAVFFYVTDFQPGWAKLPETAGEAQQLKAELETNFGFTGELVANPTRQQILDKIKAYNASLTANDQVLFFFSMHGYYDAASDLGYLVAADGMANDPYFSSWIDYNSLRPYFARCKARHVLVALDACYSGSFGSRNKGGPDKPAYAEGADCAGKIAATFRYTSRQYLSSGNKEAKTPAKSLFAAKFLEGLRKGPDVDGLLDFDDLAYWLGKVKNPEPENGYFNGHEPGGDFVFIRKDACGTRVNPADTRQTEQLSADFSAWKKAKAANTAAAYQDYLRQFPQGEFAAQAREASRKLDQDQLTTREELAWQVATEKNTVVAFQQYLRDCALCQHRTEAEADIARLKLAAPGADPANQSDDGLVFIPGGTFQMGCLPGQESECPENSKPAHPVTLPDFYIGRFEVTQALWRNIVGSDPQYLLNKGCDQCPAEGFTMDEIKDFLQRLNAKNPARQYRLPTEAEWEYAARGGQLSKGYRYAGSDTLDQVAWYAANDDGETHPVGGKKPNELGLFDMTGNVLEWCNDRYEPYRSQAQYNPTGPPHNRSGTSIFRGGFFNCTQKETQYLRVDWRWYNDQFQYHSGALGIRLARTFERDSSLLRDEQAWQEAVQTNTPKAYRRYVQAYPAGLHLAEAKNQIKPPLTPDDVLVKGGSFTMGCTDEQGERCDPEASPTHQVTLSDFYIGQYEITQLQWRTVMGDDPPDLKDKCDQCPVVAVSWNDVQLFLQTLNSKTGRQYRLPTEAEWEFAARGGTLSKGYAFSGSNSRFAVAAKDIASPVGSKLPNELGLFDMTGPVEEWCNDWYGKYRSRAEVNPAGPGKGVLRVCRDGNVSINTGLDFVLAHRSYGRPEEHYSWVGFRVARSQ